MKGCRIFFCRSLHQLLEDLEGRSPVQGFAGPVVEQVGHGIEGLLIMHRQVGALGQHLAQQVMQPRWCAAWAQGIVHAKINRQARVLARAERGVATVREALAVLHADSGDTFVRLATLRGLEGTAARAHFAGLAAVLPPALGFTGRNRRPPRDPANACLSLGYTLLHAEAVTAAQAAGLDPLLGFYHRPAFGCESLASDLIEPLRAEVDAWVAALFRDRTLREDHFTRPESPGGACLLGKAGRQTFYAEWAAHAVRPLRRWLRWRCAALARVLRAQGEAALAATTFDEDRLDEDARPDTASGS